MNEDNKIIYARICKKHIYPEYSSIITGLALIFTFLIIGFNQAEGKPQNLTENIHNKAPLFTLLKPSETGIDFTNNIFEDNYKNSVNYDYMYNGSGVGVGDFNNDGLQDIYFAGNMVKCKLYLNKRDMKFDDITQKAGVDGQGGWCNGVALADVNADGFLDIYVSRSYNYVRPHLRQNLLYINNGDLTFTERAKEYGLNASSFSTQATFFDYDLDGDLDLFQGNHPRILERSLEKFKDKQNNMELSDSDRLYRNNGDGTFTDVTIEARMLNYGYALGIISGDLNQDGRPDIYVANDYEEADKLYINNKNGTFSNVANSSLKHISNFGMGVDLADFNNDGRLDIIVADMQAEDNFRQKTQMPSMNPEKFWTLVDLGQNYQYMRNTLQLNNGNGTFSEIGLLAGVSYTDWSWAPLFADFNNDGLKDLYVTNGYRRDTRNKDWVATVSKIPRRVLMDNVMKYVGMIPSTKKENYFFINNRDLTFSNQTVNAGLGTPGFSNGAAYADLDNDGDLDIVVNNLTDPAFIYKNNTIENKSGNYLRIKLVGTPANKSGIGTKVTIKIGDDVQFQEMTCSRGYKSSVENILHFGLGDNKTVDQILVEWPNGNWQLLWNQKANQVLNIKISETNQTENKTHESIVSTMYTEVSRELSITERHIENEYDDFAKELLLPHKLSRFGPNICVADVNGDGKEDFFRGGAAGTAGILYLQQADGAFRSSTGQPWERDKKHEDLGVAFFDVERDGDMDLYVVSGGNEFPPESLLLQDRLYLNNGQGNFTRSSDKLPNMKSNGSCVVPGDYDNDGDLDLFVGGRVEPGKYPFPARSWLLNNDKGAFIDVTEKMSSNLMYIGLVTSAVWTDFDRDGLLDLIVVGEWMPVTFFRNSGKGFEDMTANYGMKNTTGWWNKIVAADFDRDGDDDYVIGNLGLNYKYKATENEPFEIYCDDFDNNGTHDIVLGYYNQGDCFPVRGKQCSSEQMPFIKHKFHSYGEFGRATLLQIYGDKLNSALNYKVRNFASSYLENNGSGKFTFQRLPNEAQLSPINGIALKDVNNDGNIDVLMAGNLYVSEVETGRADAGIGVCLIGNGAGKFVPIHNLESGFFTDLDAKDVQVLNLQNHGHLILVANNNNRMHVFKSNVLNE